MYPLRMVVLSWIVTEVFFSPLLFVLLVAGALVLVGFGRKRTALWMLGATGLLILLLSLEPVCDLLILPLENKYPPIAGGQSPRVDAIAVLGGGAMISAPDQEGASSLSPESLARLAHGIALHRSTGAPLILSGGEVWAGIEQEPWAETAEREALTLGVPRESIITESDSRTTWENALGVAMIARERHYQRIALVTSAYHMPRSVLAFERADLESSPAPTDYKTNRVRYSVVSFLPKADMLASSFRALREYAGLLLYLVRAA